MKPARGLPLRIDPAAKSSSADLPAFLARPEGCPVYHGFTVLEESRKDGWVFGTITDFESAKGCEYGDAFVIAPDGTRAGIVWAFDDLPTEVVCAPSVDRWGVYSFGFPKPVCNSSDFIECCHRILPELMKIHGNLQMR